MTQSTRPERAPFDLSRLIVIGGVNYTVMGLGLAGLIVSILVYRLFGFRFEFPNIIIERFDFAAAINDGEDWLKANVRSTTRAIAKVVTGFIEEVEYFLQVRPWPLVVAVMGLMALRFGGLRLGLFTVLAVMFWGAMDMWDPAMSTLALMGVSVLISVMFGVPLGIWCSQNDRVEAFVRPILDTMQTMPAFVYLLPAIFLFGIGETGAAMAIIIYAMPPVVRLTNLGIRQVPATSVEVAQSFGSTRLQTMVKVQIPQAIPSIILGINQTIMMALGLAVLAVFIGTGGLGREVYSALIRLKVGWAFEAGMCIVFMAIVFDRLTLAISKPVNAEALADKTQMRFRLLPQGWHRFAPARLFERGIDAVWTGLAWVFTTLIDTTALGLERALGLLSKPLGQGLAEGLRARRFFASSVLIIAGIFAWDAWVLPIGWYPDSLMFTMREPVDTAVDWLASNKVFAAFSKGLRAVIFLYLLQPLDQFLVGLPWFYLLGALFLMAWAAGGWVMAAIITFLMFLTGVAGIWEPTMETLAATLASVAVCVVVGLPLGILGAYNRTVNQIIRPVLDTMQTMPTFVYLIPVLMLFGGNKVTAIIATVIYALPPMVRMTMLGLQQLPAQVSEVCDAYGSTETQSLIKVKLPMASPSIMLGVNQAIAMALAMQVITPMVAGEGLGKVVFSAMTVADTGVGLVGGVGIVLLAVILDRLTNAATAKQRKALGL
jgi:glycine betaine/proline transport system permease protein